MISGSAAARAPLSTVGRRAARSRGSCHNGSAHMFAAETFKLLGGGERKSIIYFAFGGARLLFLYAQQNLVVVSAVVNYLGDGGGKQTWFGSFLFCFVLPSSVKSCTEQKFQLP